LNRPVQGAIFHVSGLQSLDSRLPFVATPLSDALFWIATVAIALAQLMIFRSTWRARRVAVAAGKAGSTALEWTYALAPAVALAVLLWFTSAAMHPDLVQLRGIALPPRP